MHRNWFMLWNTIKRKGFSLLKGVFKYRFTAFVSTELESWTCYQWVLFPLSCRFFLCNCFFLSAPAFQMRLLATKVTRTHWSPGLSRKALPKSMESANLISCASDRTKTCWYHNFLIGSHQKWNLNPHSDLKLLESIRFWRFQPAI